MKNIILIIISISVLLGCGVKSKIPQIKSSKKVVTQEEKITKVEKITQEEKIKKVPEEIWKCLSQPKEMVLYSLDPKIEKNGIFHNFKVLGSINVESPEIQAKIAIEIKSAVSDVDQHSAKCFDPRHGVRVTDGNTVYDFVICYACNALYLYQGDVKIKEIAIGSSVETLNGILKNANVPLPEQAK